LHATGFGHIFAMHWAPEPVIDGRTLAADDTQKIMDIVLALNNEGFYLFSFGAFLLSTAVTEADVDAFLAGLERALHAVELI
jgi:glutamate-1-semialdehyde aminotransferase